MSITGLTIDDARTSVSVSDESLFPKSFAWEGNLEGSMGGARFTLDENAFKMSYFMPDCLVDTNITFDLNVGDDRKYIEALVSYAIDN